MTDLNRSQWVSERYRKPLDNLTATQIWNELLLDAKMNHATDLDRFAIAIAMLSRKWKKHADAIMFELESKAKELNGYGLPLQPPPQF